MHMVITSLTQVIVTVFIITVVGYIIGKFTKFGNSDEIIQGNEEDQK